MTDISPNAPGAATETNAVPSMDSIAAKMTAMREQTLRNKIRPTNETETGSESSAEDSSPVVPDVPEVDDLNTEVLDGSNQETDRSSAEDGKGDPKRQ